MFDSFDIGHSFEDFPARYGDTFNLKNALHLKSSQPQNTLHSLPSFLVYIPQVLWPQSMSKGLTTELNSRCSLLSVDSHGHNREYRHVYDIIGKSIQFGIAHSNFNNLWFSLRGDDSSISTCRHGRFDMFTDQINHIRPQVVLHSMLASRVVFMIRREWMSPIGHESDRLRDWSLPYHQFKRIRQH